MALIKWDPSFSVGVAALDSDHRGLAELINQLNTACRQRQGAESITALLDRLKTHVAAHFAREEEMMERLGYPGFADHWNHHVDTNAALHRVFELGASVEDLTVQHDMLVFLKAWFTGHVLGADQKLRGFFIAKGVADVPASEMGSQQRGWLRRLRGG